jgi:hypothetical protein
VKAQPARRDLRPRSARSAGSAGAARSPRRLVTALVAGAAAVALLGGCGFGTRQQAAAVVDGQQISQDDVQTTYEQLQAAKYDFTENVVLTGLIMAPLLEKAVAPSGGWKPDSTYAQVMATIPDASESTKDFVSAVSLIQSQTMTPAQVEAYRTDLKKADITINPRFGQLVHDNNAPVYFTIGQTTPNWIKTSTSPSTPATTPAS